MLHVGVLALGVADVERAASFWCAALDYELRTDGFGGWATLLVPRSGSGLMIALQRSETVPQDRPRPHLDLHAADAAEQAAEADRLVSLTTGSDPAVEVAGNTRRGSKVLIGRERGVPTARWELSSRGRTLGGLVARALVRRG